MAETVIYIIDKTDGSTAFAIQPRTFDGSTGVQRNTDLTLYGNATPSWGERFNENFYRMLETFACPRKTSVTPPEPQDESTLGAGFGINVPIVGQQWFDTRIDLDGGFAGNTLYVYDGTTWNQAASGAAITDIVGLQTALDDRYTEAEADAAFVDIGGDTMTGPLILDADPVAALGAATMQYVDNAITGAGHLELAGGTMTGPLILDADPVAALEAATKQYVDSLGTVPMNMLINGDFSIWQRGVTFPIIEGETFYTADRWRASSGPDVTTYSAIHRRVAFGPPEPANAPTNRPQYYNQWTISTNTGAGSIRPSFSQRIEGVQTLENTQTVLSFWGHSINSDDVIVRVTQNFGSGGSSAVDVIAGFTFNLTTTWTRFELPISMPTIATKTIGTDSFVDISFEIDFTQTGEIDIAQVQWESGGSASAFETRLAPMELAMCERYYQVGDWREHKYSEFGVTNSSFVPFRTTMRDTPSIDAGNTSFGSGGVLSGSVAAANFETNGFSATWDVITMDQFADPFITPWAVEAEL